MQLYNVNIEMTLKCYYIKYNLHLLTVQIMINPFMI